MGIAMIHQTLHKDIVRKKMFFVISISLVSLLFSIPGNQVVFAQETHTINIPPEAADPGAPYFWQIESTGNTTGEIVIPMHDTVEWVNLDSAAHTVTSGDPGNGANNIFDSGLFGPGKSFSFQFAKEGKFDYFCVVHPWMIGFVTVMAESDDNNNDDNDDRNTTMNSSEMTAMKYDSKNKFPFSGEAVVVIPFTSDNQDCQDRENCYLPMDLTVEKDTLVIWHNFDDESRSILSGNTIDGPDGIFESGIINPGESFSHRFETQKIHEYYDILRPWESGKITVTAKVIDKEEKMTILEGMSDDGTITVEFEAMNPTQGEAIGLHAKFIGMDGSLIENINYDLVATQNGMEVLMLDNNHNHAGIEEHWTDVLRSDDPVDVKITILGIGPPGEESSWTGPKGEVMMFTVVPEFGAIAAMVLAVAIISIIAVSTKSRLSVMPRL